MDKQPYSSQMTRLILLLVTILAVGATQVINWGTCPPEQDVSAYTMTCANLTFPLNYNDPTMGNVTAFVRRFYVNEPTNSSVWMVAGGPGDTTITLVPACDYFLANNPSYTCYCQDARGTGLSSYMSCGENQPVGPLNPFNETTLDAYNACFQQIKNTYAGQLEYYGTYYAAMDLLGTIQAVNPALVHLYAQSYGTYAANFYLQLPGARADVVILDGPVPPNRWPLENNAEWASQVAQDVISECVGNSSVCNGALSDMGHIPRLVMDAIIDGTLPCLQNISWLSAVDGQFWTSVYANYFTGGATRNTAHLILGPMFYRMYRCSASDIDQLNFMNDYMQVLEYTPVSYLYYSLGVAVNIGSSELYSFSQTPLDYTMQVQRSARLLASASTEMLVAYARNVSGFPLYTVNSTYYMQFADLKVPTIIFVGTLDANTENGLGAWEQKGFDNKAVLLNVPYNSHITFAYDNPCVDNIMLEFFNSLGTNYDASCLSQIQEPDWDGSTTAAQDYSYTIFGTYDLWNNNYEKDTAADTCTQVIYKTDDDCNCKNYNVTAILCGILIPLLLIIIGLLTLIYYLHQKPSSPLSGQESKQTPAVELRTSNTV